MHEQTQRRAATAEEEVVAAVTEGASASLWGDEPAASRSLLLGPSPTEGTTAASSVRERDAQLAATRVTIEELQRRVRDLEALNGALAAASSSPKNTSAKDGGGVGGGLSPDGNLVRVLLEDLEHRDADVRRLKRKLAKAEERHQTASATSGTKLDQLRMQLAEKRAEINRASSASDAALNRTASCNTDAIRSINLSRSIGSLVVDENVLFITTLNM